jgi:hypothetical protein
MVSQVSSLEFKLHMETRLISLYLAHVKLVDLENKSGKNILKLIINFHQHAHISKTYISDQN